MCVHVYACMHEYICSFLNVFVCVYASVYIFVWICVYLWVYVHIHEHIHVHIHVNEYIYVHAYMSIYVNVCKCKSMNIYVYMWKHAWAYVYIHEWICICAYMHAYVYEFTYVCDIVCTWRESWVIAFWEKGIWRNGVKAGAGYSAKGWDSGDLGTESLFLFPFALRRKLGRVQACLGLLCCLSIWCSRFCRDNILELAVYGGPLKRSMGGWLLSLGLPLSVVTQEVKSEARQQSQCYRNGPHGLQAFMTLWFKV